MKKLIALVTACCVGAVGLAGCGNQSTSTTSGDKALKIVCTNFSGYDFARQIAGDKAEVTMLLKPGAEAHSYEPTPEDIKAIQSSDLFVYTGGDADEWVEHVLESIDTNKHKAFKMMDAVDLREEEIVEGMVHEHHHEEDAHEEHAHHEHAHEEDAHHELEHEEHAHHEHEHAHEMDEHVWTSPVNAIAIVKAMSDNIISLDETDAEYFKKNTETYVGQLEALDKEFRDVIDHAKRKEIIVGDRFPFLYFAKEYGLSYYAAFPGCSKDTGSNPATVAFLIDKVKADNIPVVFHIEMSNEQMSKSIAEATGAKNMLLNAIHNVTAEQFEKGVTYIDLMKENVKALKEALN